MGWAKIVSPMEWWIMGLGIFDPTSSCLAWREDAPKHLSLQEFPPAVSGHALA